jgi:hypothetical protein
MKKKNQENINNEELGFATFCIVQLARVLKLSSSEVYNRLKRSGILDEYIIPSYDVLHTFSLPYLLDDLQECMKEKGELQS